MGFNDLGRAPTPRDAAQSDVHHVDSVRFNLGHAKAHIDEALKHAKKVSGAMRRSPRFAKHIRALSTALK
jgi:hypothetical protein